MDRRVPSRRIRRIPAALCLLLLALAPARAGKVESAYFEGRLVDFTVMEPGKNERAFRMGPWRFGVRVAQGGKPRDGRLNLYLVCPGSQHRSAGYHEFDHNDVINILPVKDGPVEWDVYWAVVLDRSLTADLRSERDLLLHAQERFTPNELFEFDDIPAAQVLRVFLKIGSVEDLERFRNKQGTLPRLIIVPAGFAVRASATKAASAPVKSEAGSKAASSHN